MTDPPTLSRVPPSTQILWLLMSQEIQGNLANSIELHQPLLSLFVIRSLSYLFSTLLLSYQQGDLGVKARIGHRALSRHINLMVNKPISLKGILDVRINASECVGALQLERFTTVHRAQRED